MTRTDRLTHAATAATLATSGAIHAQLYLSGYRSIPVIGTLFLLQASASVALAVLLLAGTLLRPPALLYLAAAGTAAGALAGFAASRTTGIFGFTERGLQPAPQSLLTLLAETATLALLAVITRRAMTLSKRFA
jgi:hypothetical protein